MSKPLTAHAELSQLDRQSMLHPFTPIAAHQENGGIIMTSGKGTHVFDSQGKSYLDAFAGLWCVNIGYGREEIADAVADQIRKLAYFHSFLGMGNEPSIRLADRLTKMTPEPLAKAFFGLTGSDGNDTQIKIIWLYNNLRGKPEKKKLIARRGGYHGVTVAAASLSGLPNLHGGFDVPTERFLHVTTPHHYRFAEPGMTEEDFSKHLAKELEDLILAQGPEQVAAFFAEPVMGAGGVFVPPAGYYQAIIPVLKRYDVLFVADEVVCGFGRLGTLFGSNYYDLHPDMMTVAKGLTSGYLPLSSCLISEEIWSVLKGAATPFGHGFTYSAHPTSAAAAHANLDIVEREGIVANAAAVGAYLQSELRQKLLGHPLVGEVRGVGMVAALEIVADKKQKTSFDPALNVPMQIYKAVLGRGVLVRPIPNTIALSPPLIFTKEEVDQVIQTLHAGLDEVAGNLKKDGVWSG